MTSVEHKIVAVVPAHERDRRRVLFDTLEEAFPVRFEGRSVGGLRGADAAVLIAAGPDADRAVARAGVPSLVARASEPGSGHEDASFELSAQGPLDRRLRGSRIHDPVAGMANAVPAEHGDAVLAARDGIPLWVARADGGARQDTVAVAPAELGPEEGLRERLQDGRALALLPLVCFLREITAELAFRPPPLRASFLMDDPNLHWRSYGHLRYRQLARHADEHGYHVAMAMVPLDGWLAHPGAVRLFRERSDRLSLLCHGNNHVLEELMRPRPRQERRALLAQALRRVDSFERRTGVRVARVMTAPHGGCSEEMTRDMLLLGYDGLCIGRPYPWAARPPLSWLARPAGTSRLAGFAPATAVVGGLPVLLRRSFDLSPGDLALRAFLDQPLVIYGHHDDLRDGLDPFAEWADRVRDVGPARWTSLDEIAATNVATREDGGLLRLRMYGRRAVVEVPAGVDRVRVELPPGHDGAERVRCGPFGTAAPGEDVALHGGAGRIELTLVRDDALQPGAIGAPAWRPWPIARRVAGESRDRLGPVYRRLTTKPARTDFERFPAASTARATRE
jgi:hypothetical protein